MISRPSGTRVVNGRDLWAGYPWLGRSPTGAALWITRGELLPILDGAWPGGLHASDHSIDTGYCANLAAIAAAA